MAHNEIYPSGVSHTCLGIEWNSASYTTYVTIAPTIWRWDEANTNNYGDRWAEGLSPDLDHYHGRILWYLLVWMGELRYEVGKLDAYDRSTSFL